MKYCKGFIDFFPCQINHSVKSGFFVAKKIKFFSKKVLTNIKKYVIV